MSATNDDGVAPPTVKDDEQNHQIELNKLSETENVVTNEEQKEKSHGKYHHV